MTHWDVSMFLAFDLVDRMVGMTWAWFLHFCVC